MGEKDNSNTIPGTAYDKTQEDAGPVLPEDRLSGELARPADDKKAPAREFADLQPPKEVGSGERRADGRVAEGDAGVAMVAVRAQLVSNPGAPGEQELQIFLENPRGNYDTFKGDEDFLRCLAAYLRVRQFKIGDRVFVLTEFDHDDFLSLKFTGTIFLQPYVERVDGESLPPESEWGAAGAPKAKSDRIMIGVLDAINALVPKG